MASILHSNATPRIRQELQDSHESLATLVARYSLNEKTVLKWQHATGIEAKKSGPATLTEVEQQALVRSVDICAYPWMTSMSSSNRVFPLCHGQACIDELKHT